jgi:hypothetical protein
MTLKLGVRLLGIKPELLVALQAAESLWRDEGLPGVTITAAVDGLHSTGSEHYVGNAVDLRLHDLGAGRRDAVVAKLRDQLGADFDVLREGVGTPGDHLHVEYDPKAALTA